MKKTKRRDFYLSSRHDQILTEMARKLATSMTAVIQRALELLEEKESKRDKEVGK